VVSYEREVEAPQHVENLYKQLKQLDLVLQRQPYGWSRIAGSTAQGKSDNASQ